MSRTELIAVADQATPVDEHAGRRAVAPALEMSGLGVSFRQRGSAAPVRVLESVDLLVRPGEIVGVIGETGSGKTTLARAVVGLVDADRGEVSVAGRRLTGLRARARRQWRRSGAVQFVFQDPLRSLDPDITVGRIIGEGLAITGVARAERHRRVAVALERVGLDQELAGRTPAALSGGQRQRVSIARAIVSEPRLLICDEPVSALDASNRNHILRLIAHLRDELGLGVLLISHDLSSLAGISDRVAVLYRGRLVEDGPIAEVFTRPRHPYTALLVASAPSVRQRDRLTPAQLRPADGRSEWTGGGCVFAHRCRFATSECATVPQTVTASGGWAVACHHHDRWRDQLPPATPPATPPGDTAAPSIGKGTQP